MITAVDSSVLIDIFNDDVQNGAASAILMRQCLHDGKMVVCEIVWAEVCAVFPNKNAFQSAMQLLQVDFSPMNQESALYAGELWHKYRKEGGKKERVIADFLIAAHAQKQCDRLLTRDRGFSRKYFGKLKVLTPK